MATAPQKDGYRTPKTQARIETTVKGSRFVATVAPAASPEAAMAIVEGVRAEFASASHHCWAYRIGVGDKCRYRSDDAGEPSGSAGKPILQALESRGVSDAVLVVTRYFGGTKLGIGGLIRAYGGAAFAVLDEVHLEIREATAQLELTFSYDLTGQIHAVLNAHDATVESSVFEEAAKLRVSVLSSNEGRFVRALMDATSGKILVSGLSG